MGRIKGPEVNGKKWRDRNRPLTRQPLEQVAEGVAAYDRVLALSSEIRVRHGLPSIKDGPSICAARKRLAGAKQPIKIKAPLTPEQRVDEIAKRRRAREAEEAKDRKALAELVDERLVKVSYVASKLKVSRQAIYQLAG